MEYPLSGAVLVARDDGTALNYLTGLTPAATSVYPDGDRWYLGALLGQPVRWMRAPVFVYAPAGVAEPLRLALQVVVLPAAAFTGLFLWRQAAVQRALGGMRRVRAHDAP